MTNPFDKISDKNKRKLLKQLETSTFTFKKNTNILSSINNDNILGVIIEGYIQIIRTDYNGDRTIVEELTDNNIFGSNISSLSNKEINIITKEDSKIIFIDYNYIINENEINNYYYIQFLKNVLQIITQKIKEKNERIEILTQKSIRNKILRYLNIIARKNGSKNIYLPFTFSDLADYLSIDRSAMTREFKHLKEEGFIEIKGKRITILY